MAQVFIKKAFAGKLGSFSPGPRSVTLPDHYAQELAENGLVDIIGTNAAGNPEPSRRQAMRGAPQAKKPGERTPLLGDGPAIQPASSQAARAQRKRTPKKSASGVTQTPLDEA